VTLAYADDWYIYNSQKHIEDAETVLQKELDNFERWTKKQDSISLFKTIVFTRSKPGNGRPALNLKPQ
jgi:hypothetical protein